MEKYSFVAGGGTHEACPLCISTEDMLWMGPGQVVLIKGSPTSSVHLLHAYRRRFFEEIFGE